MKTYKERQVSKERWPARGILRRLSPGRDVQTKVWALVRTLLLQIVQMEAETWTIMWNKI